MIYFLPGKVVWKFLFVLIFCFVFLSVAKDNTYAASLSINPNSGNVSGNFDVVLFVDPEGAQVSGTDAIVKYDPVKFEVVTISNGIFEQYLKKNINKTTGTIEISAYNTNTFVTVKSALATITFKALASGGSTYLSFVYTQGSTSDSNVVAGEQDVLSSVSGGSYTLAEVPGSVTNTTTSTSTVTESSQPATPATGSTALLFIVPLLSLLLITSGFYLFRSTL